MNKMTKIILSAMMVFTMTIANAQSKKEQIEKLTFSLDSLNQLVAVERQNFITTLDSLNQLLSKNKQDFELEMDKSSITIENLNSQLIRLYSINDSINIELITKEQKIDSLTLKNLRLLADIDSLSNPKIDKENNWLLIESNLKKPTDANLLLKQIQNKKTKVLFHGIGTEPFWDLYITEKEVLYSVNEDYINSFILLTPFDKNIKTQKISYKSKENQVFNVTITKEPAGDGMSERTYPYTVIFSETDLNGAGDSKLIIFD
ncbi:MAG: hypothetical protein O3C47_09045 [Bacteroidetes bacterium]|nr:hypothetical protein [Bacteroidota bacterium]